MLGLLRCENTRNSVRSSLFVSTIILASQASVVFLSVIGLTQYFHKQNIYF